MRSSQRIEVVISSIVSVSCTKMSSITVLFFPAIKTLILISTLLICTHIYYHGTIFAAFALDGFFGDALPRRVRDSRPPAGLQKFVQEPASGVL